MILSTVPGKSFQRFLKEKNNFLEKDAPCSNSEDDEKQKAFFYEHYEEISDILEEEESFSKFFVCSKFSREFVFYSSSHSNLYSCFPAPPEKLFLLFHALKLDC